MMTQLIDAAIILTQFALVSSLNYEMERAGMDTYNYNAEEAQRRADNIRRGRPPKNE